MELAARRRWNNISLLGPVNGQNPAASLLRVNSVFHLQGKAPQRHPPAGTVSASDTASILSEGADTITVDPGSLLVHLDGSPTTVQRAAPGSPTLVVDGSADIAYADAGVTEVISSVDSAIVLYGADTTRVSVTGRGSVVVSDGRPATAPSRRHPLAARAV